MANQRNTVQVTDSGVVKVVSVGVQGPAGSSAFLGAPIDQDATATGNEILQYKATPDEWQGVTSLDGITIDAGTY
tara:strand:- start:177 stop:401 length:225 start_codon:yes stop_codon:yes gene_type:complete